MKASLTAELEAVSRDLANEVGSHGQWLRAALAAGKAPLPQGMPRSQGSFDSSSDHYEVEAGLQELSLCTEAECAATARLRRLQGEF